MCAEDDGASQPGDMAWTEGQIRDGGVEGVRARTGTRGKPLRVSGKAEQTGTKKKRGRRKKGRKAEGPNDTSGAPRVKNRLGVYGARGDRCDELKNSRTNDDNKATMPKSAAEDLLGRRKTVRNVIGNESRRESCPTKKINEKDEHLGNHNKTKPHIKNAWKTADTRLAGP